MSQFHVPRVQAMKEHDSVVDVETTNKLPEDDRQFRPKHVGAIIKK
jgi:hypothetical protein